MQRRGSGNPLDYSAKCQSVHAKNKQTSKHSIKPSKINFLRKNNDQGAVIEQYPEITQGQGSFPPAKAERTLIRVGQ